MATDGAGPDGSGLSEWLGPTVQRESVDDALMIVESFGPWGADLNDAHRRQIVLANEVHRLRLLYEMAVRGRAEMRTALRQERDQLEARYMALVEAVADGRAMQPAPPILVALGPNVGIEPPYSVGSNAGLGPCIRSEEMVMDNGHDSDCATHNAPAYPAGPCECMPTQAMCRAAVVYLNGADVYDKLPREVLEIEEGIYAEVWKAMRAAGPANAENVDEG